MVAPEEGGGVINYERLVGRLTERACRILGVVRSVAATYVVDGLGKSPVDFALDVLKLYLTEKLLFSGDEEALFAFLAEVMGHDILDQLRSFARKTTIKVSPLSGHSEDGEVVTTGLDDFDSGFSVEELVQGELLKERLYAMLEHSEPELYEMVFAIIEFNALTPREIADIVGTTPAEIQNRKKRLRTFLAKHNFCQPPKGSKI
jgi:DNA-directed RNA polymerase specialized sigma24 family protein